MYPEYAEINGKEYKIDTDYRTALKCFEVIEDVDIDDYERAMAIVYLLFDFIPKEKDINLFLEKATSYLQCGKDYKEQKKKEPDMDFEQDKGRIISSFMSDYHVDLNTTKMHFWQFIDCIEGLTEQCILNRVRDIRNFDLSEEKDPKRRKEIIDAKKSVALKKKSKHTKEQREEVFAMYEKLGLRRE